MFQPDPFARQVNQYMIAMGYDCFSLTKDECDHLKQYKGNRNATPEATIDQIKDSLDIEVKRGLARRYGFELLDKAGSKVMILSHAKAMGVVSDELTELHNSILALHQAFIADQAEPKLSYDAFAILAKGAYALNDDLKHAIRISCILTVNDYFRRIFESFKIEIKDSEMFLSTLAGMIHRGEIQLPLTDAASPETKKYLTALFYPGMHFRQMLFTEGGTGMFEFLRAGIRSGAVKQEGFYAWQWRWLTNLFGFQLGRGAKIYNDSMHSICVDFISDLDELFKEPSKDILQTHLCGCAFRAGLELINGKLVNDNLKKFYGHLTAMFHTILIDSRELGKPIAAGYEAFKAKYQQDANQLQDLYIARIANLESTTPTYVPAILNNAYDHFFKETNSVSEAIQLAVEFSCDAFLALEKALALNPKQLISCLEISQRSNLDNLLTSWKENKNSFVFGVGEENGEFKLKAVALLPRVRLRN